MNDLPKYLDDFVFLFPALDRREHAADLWPTPDEPLAADEPAEVLFGYRSRQKREHTVTVKVRRDEWNQWLRFWSWHLVPNKARDRWSLRTTIKRKLHVSAPTLLMLVRGHEEWPNARPGVEPRGHLIRLDVELQRSTAGRHVSWLLHNDANPTDAFFRRAALDTAHDEATGRRRRTSRVRTRVATAYTAEYTLDDGETWTTVQDANGQPLLSGRRDVAAAIASTRMHHAEADASVLPE